MAAQAMPAAAELGDTAAITEVASKLRHPDPEVRALCVQTLGALCVPGDAHAICQTAGTHPCQGEADDVVLGLSVLFIPKTRVSSSIGSRHPRIRQKCSGHGYRQCI